MGGNLCNSSPAGDTIAPLIALQARCVIVGRNATREVPAEAFCTAPGRNVLQKGELLATIVVPPQLAKSGSAYERFIPRNEMDIAVVGAASWVRLSTAGDTIEQARVGLAAVAPTPKFAVEASPWLAGKPATEATFAQAGVEEVLTSVFRRCQVLIVRDPGLAVGAPLERVASSEVHGACSQARTLGQRVRLVARKPNTRRARDDDDGRDRAAGLSPRVRLQKRRSCCSLALEPEA